MMQSPNPVPADPANKNQARRIGSSLLWSQVGRVSDMVISLAFTVLVVRLLGPQDYAVYAVVWSIVNVAVLIASLGYGETLARYLPTLDLNGGGAAAALVRRLLAERGLISLIVALAVWAGTEPLAAWTHMPALPPLIGWVMALAVAQGLWELLIAYYTAALRMRDHAGVRTVGQLVSLGLALLLFAVFGVKVWVPLLAVLVSYFVSSALYFFGARRTLMAPGKPIGLNAARRFGGYVWLTNLATFGLASQIDVLLIAALLSGSTQISFYNVAVLLLSRLYSILTGWTAILMPGAADAYARRGDAGMARSFDLYMKVNLAAIVPPFIFVAAFAAPFITVFFGEAFSPAGSLLFVFALFALTSAFAGANVCHPLLYVANCQRTLLWLRIAAGALNIGLDVLLIPPLGAAGAVIATSASNLLTHVIELALLRRVTRVGYPIAVAAKVFVASALAALPAFLLPRSGWIGLMGGGVLFGVIFAIVIWRLHPLSEEDYATLAVAMPRLRPVLRWFAVS